MAVVSIDEALAWCLESIESGDHSRRECLERYPGLRADLEPLLDLACELRAMPCALPSVDFRLRLRSRLMAQARGRMLPARNQARRRARGGFLRRAGAWAPIGAVIVALFATVGAASASADALPGDFLYPAKLMVEAAQELLTFDEQAEAALHLRFADERLMELEALVESGRLGELDGLVLAFEYHWAEAQMADGTPGVGLGIGEIPPGFAQHVQVLTGVLLRAPESAQPALLRVLMQAEAALSQGPGRSGAAPGHQDTPPGQADETAEPPSDHGRPSDAAGNPPETPPGQSGDPGNPQQTPPGQSGEPGNPHATPPVQSEGSGNPHGTPPGQADK